jgi:hypothetical protein
MQGRWPLLPGRLLRCSMTSQQWHDFFPIGGILLVCAALGFVDTPYGSTVRSRLTINLGIVGFIMAVYLLTLLI